jgi:hypothetical protein
MAWFRPVPSRPAPASRGQTHRPSTHSLLEALEPRVLLSVAIDFDNYTLKAFGAQDVVAAVTVTDSGKTLGITGNSWKKIDLNYNITRNTVLQFDYRSDARGEVQGIALETDNTSTAERTFQVFGSQDFGTPQIEDYGTPGGAFKRYTIAVGNYLAGQSMNALVFANDHDVANPTAHSQFSNVSLYEQPAAGTVNFNVTPPTSYGTQDKNSTWSLDASGATLNLSGNGWKKIDLPYKVTANTVVEFDFSSSAQGEVHAIGLEADALESPDRFFRVYGTQDWGISAPGGNYPGSGVKHYVIPVGKSFTGDINALVFANDHDVSNPTARSTFSNVRVYEAADTTPTTPAAPTTPGYPAPLQTVVVGTRTELVNALNNAKAGTHILVKPGTYSGGIYVSGRNGTASNPIVIRAYDPASRPVITGGSEAIKFSKVSHLQVHDLVFERASSNGINIDDGGVYGSSHHITLNNLVVRNIGSYGNQDGIKLSGVDDVTVKNSTVQNWGDGGGSGVDMVGCHRALLLNNKIISDQTSSGNGIQAKGGSSEVTIRGNRFTNAGERAVQLGGNTELRYFRPQPPGAYEVRNAVVEGNIFVGSGCAVAFINSDATTVRFNTIYNPGRYVFRILRENWGSSFATTRNGVITDNIIQHAGLGAEINIGSGTSASTFKFARNWWYDSRTPSSSKPSLPSTESGGDYGSNPQFVNPSGGDFHIKSGSNAVNYGAYALPR